MHENNLFMNSIFPMYYIDSVVFNRLYTSMLITCCVNKELYKQTIKLP